MNKCKKTFINTLKYIFLFIILLCIHMFLMLVASLIPAKQLEKHVIESSEVLFEEGEKKNINLGYKQENIFTFTDALMINIAYSVDSTDPIQSMLLARKNYVPGQTLQVYIDSQYNLGASEQYINKKNGDLYQTKELYGLMHGENITDSFEYARYWHGYLVILRPLLAITNYTGIRIILLIITTILVIQLLYKIYKKLDISIAIIFFIGLLSVSIFIVTQGINEILVFIVALIFSIILLSKKHLDNHINELFFVIGSITVFIDFLTAPLVTLGIPLIIYLLLLQKYNKNLKDIILSLVKICITWGLGYALTWISKWIITQVMLGRPVISQAIEQAKFRINLGTSKLGYIDVVMRNIRFLSKNVVLAILSLLIIYIAGNLILNNKKDINVKQNIKNAMPYIITAIFPFMWYFILQEHSYIHAFFTYRILIITVISLFIIVNKILEIKKVTR